MVALLLAMLALAFLVVIRWSSAIREADCCKAEIGNQKEMQVELQRDFTNCSIEREQLNRVITKLFAVIEGPQAPLVGWAFRPDGTVVVGHVEPPRGGLRLELAECRADCEQLADAFAALQLERDGLAAVNAALKSSLNQCRAELSRRPKCPCECERAQPEPIQSKMKRHKR